jgi:hypothetical protein
MGKVAGLPLIVLRLKYKKMMFVLLPMPASVSNELFILTESSLSKVIEKRPRR